MQVKFNRPVKLGGKTYLPGEHDVTVPDAERWFFDALLADGQIDCLLKTAEAPEATPAAPEPEKPRKRAQKGD